MSGKVVFRTGGLPPLFVPLVSILITFSGTSHAGTWHIHCVNDSCESSQGALKVFWTKNDTGYGQLTGVAGIPISIEDFSAAEKKIEMSMEKAITQKKGLNANVKVTPSEEFGGPAGDVSRTGENVFARKKSMSQTKTMGKKISIDYALAFVEWWAISHPQWNTGWEKSDGMGRYYSAMEDLLTRYKARTLHELVADFFFEQNIELVDQVDITEEITDENRAILLTKYLGLREGLLTNNLKMRYLVAFRRLKDIEVNEIQSKRMSEQYHKDLIAIKRLLKPGQTVKALMAEGQKDFAMAKWVGDVVVKKEMPQTTLLTDRYFVGVKVVEDAGYKKRFLPDFEKALKNNDPVLTLVTVPPIPVKRTFPVLAVTLVVVVVMLSGGLFFLRQKGAPTGAAPIGLAGLVRRSLSALLRRRAA